MTTGSVDRDRIVDEGAVAAALARGAAAPPERARAVLEKARALAGLDLEELAVLVAAPASLREEIRESARQVKQAIYGRRIVLFAPLYFSNRCANECLYCAFRATNRALPRTQLTREEIVAETEALVAGGHKRVLLVAAEGSPERDFPKLLEAIEAVYSVHRPDGEIRRINVNVAPLDVARLRELKAAGIGTYQLFQETYHRATYEKVHVAGRKRDFDARLSAMDRAMEAGLDDVGIGPLLGLYDWRFELLAMRQHIAHLERRFGVGPHTVSVPRLEPAAGSELAARPPHAVSDEDFLDLVAMVRLAVPYTGIILSTRETPEIRRQALELGVSQISAGSRTAPGAYAQGAGAAGQFEVGDTRPLDEVVRDLCDSGHVPSFCTACYRLGRTGADFMDLAKPGEIRHHCDPNALSTFREYLLDHASAPTAQAGGRTILRVLQEMDRPAQAVSKRLLESVELGRRDVFV